MIKKWKDQDIFLVKQVKYIQNGIVSFLNVYKDLCECVCACVKYDEREVFSRKLD